MNSNWCVFGFGILILAALCSQNYVLAAPNSLEESEQRMLVESFVKFLREDKQLSKTFRSVEQNLRNKRQAGKQGDLDSDEYDQPKEPGFFDRAAKFVTELLQRFLKWINSNDQ